MRVVFNVHMFIVSTLLTALMSVSLFSMLIVCVSVLRAIVEDPQQSMAALFHMAMAFKHGY